MSKIIKKFTKPISKVLKKIVPKNYKEIININDFFRLKTLKLSVC